MASEEQGERYEDQRKGKEPSSNLKEGSKHHPLMNILTDIEPIVNQVIYSVLTYEHQNAAYIDALTYSLTRMMRPEEDSDEEMGDETMDAIMETIGINPEDVGDLNQFRNNPEWNQIQDVSNRYEKATAKVDDKARKVYSALNKDVEGAIQYYNCLSTKFTHKKSDLN